MSIELKFMSASTIHHIQVMLKTAPQAETKAIFMAFHNRSVGISPSLASLLADAMYANAPEAQGIWGAVEAKISETARELVPSSTSPVSLEKTSRGFHLGWAPMYTVFRIAIPIVQRACIRSRQTILYCGNALSDGVNEKDYRTYCRNLDEEVNAVIASDNEIPAIFWKNHALTMLGMPSGQKNSQTIYFIDHRKASTLIELKPLPPNSTSMIPERINLAQDTRLTHPQRKQAGIDGVKITRRDTDLHRMLLSEYLMPDEIRMDRLINSGYWATKQPDEHVQRRDVLVIGMAPENTDSLVGTFLKSIWLEMLIRLSKIFVESNLKKSEFRWIHRTSAAPHVTFATLLHNLDLSRIHDRTDEKSRARVLSRAGWYPQILEPRCRFDSPGVHYGQNQNHQPTGVNDWVANALKGQRDLQAWSRQETSATRQVLRIREKHRKLTWHANKPLDFRQYKAVMTILFAPQSQYEQLRGGQWQHEVAPEFSARTGTLVYPLQIIGDGWLWEMRGSLTQFHVDRQSPQAASRLLGDVSSTLIQNIVRGIQLVQ